MTFSSDSPNNSSASERRSKPDRRQATRHGKYDRRRNRCEKCLAFQPTGSGTDGLCTVHQQVIRAEDYACLQFQKK